MEIVHLDGGGDGLTDEDLNAFCSGFPIDGG